MIEAPNAVVRRMPNQKRSEMVIITVGDVQLSRDGGFLVYSHDILWYHTVLDWLDEWVKPERADYQRKLASPTRQF